MRPCLAKTLPNHGMPHLKRKLSSRRTPFRPQNATLFSDPPVDLRHGFQAVRPSLRSQKPFGTLACGTSNRSSRQGELISVMKKPPYGITPFSVSMTPSQAQIHPSPYVVSRPKKFQKHHQPIPRRNIISRHFHEKFQSPLCSKRPKNHTSSKNMTSGFLVKN